MDYQESGVHLETGRAFVRQIHQLVSQTRRPEVLGTLGGFSGLFQLPTGYHEPLLVSGTDGVGTKLRLAQSLNRHDTIGIDLVAMCVNDVLTVGAEPLFFLDYLATGKLEPDAMTQVVAGIVQGCKQAGCALLGGETAEMPGFYAVGEYDLAGFCVGIVEKAKVCGHDRVQQGDRIVGLASTGVHSNGYSLIRKILTSQSVTSTTKGPDSPTDELTVLAQELKNCPADLGGASLGEILLTPTQIYVPAILAALRAEIPILSMAHITGGGLPENLPRCLASDQSAHLDPSAWAIPPIFPWIAHQGNVQPADMFGTFNMGVGFAVVVPSTGVETAIATFAAQGITAWLIGEVVPGNGQVLGLPT